MELPANAKRNAARSYTRCLLGGGFETARSIGREPIGFTANRSEKGKSEIPKSMSAIQVI